eukprot:TRINITY_DN817_c0_g1_i9.p1 TRINITY_DN817_c0_g1~~TRINITY_DN817_c0_g1_i9.p1  ORF type:complete len:718 (-),score=152.92 TRINITY_DN817_c0_g1_i9:984-3137(-)
MVLLSFPLPVNLALRLLSYSPISHTRPSPLLIKRHSVASAVHSRVASLRHRAGGSNNGDASLGPTISMESIPLDTDLKPTVSEKTRDYLKRDQKVTDLIPSKPPSDDEPVVVKEKLGQWLATGICGNNITSSCLYVIALCADPAGKYAPIALAFIAFVLFLFRKIYEEVVGALPVNGGTYNLLLNTTSKSKASIAACLTMLSYVTTAVISSSSANRYVQSLFSDPDMYPVVWTTIALLTIAALLNLFGITESAVVALLIFSFHMLSCGMLIIAGFIRVFRGMPTHPETGMNMLEHNWKNTSPADGWALGLFYGYASALLGISGFESSSNYVEQQKDGVFPQTLRNMWIAVTIINPVTALLAQMLLPMPAIVAEAESGALLSKMGAIAGGDWLEIWIIIDAALVLSGAVLTAFVGYTGLVHRMTVDRCLPQVLLQVNKLRGTRHWIILSFWALTSLLVLFTNGNIEIMAGIYTMAFLSVMTLFTVGNMLRKVKRQRLPTPVVASWGRVIFACGAVVMGLIGNVLSRDSKSIQGFIYFGAAFVIPVFIMLNRTAVMKAIRGWFEWSAHDDIESKPGIMGGLGRFCKRRIYDPLGRKCEELRQKPMVYFTASDDPRILRLALEYMTTNELRLWVKLVRVYKDPADMPKDGEAPPVYDLLNRMYPNVRIDFVAMEGEFGPAAVQRLSYEMHIPSQFMFISAFGDKFPYTFTDLGGLRLITE